MRDSLRRSKSGVVVVALDFGGYQEKSSQVNLAREARDPAMCHEAQTNRQSWNGVNVYGVETR